jgi:catechol 2,3-dioxygenase-like lactoylglutathione lyase family enzyme
MPQARKLTPNLVVSDVARSVAFYRDVLGFAPGLSVPDRPPYVFASVTSGPVEIFFNSLDAAAAEYPAFKNRPIGGTLTLFIEVDAIDALHESLKERVSIVMPLERKWYGMTEFALSDPDGYLITFAQPGAEPEKQPA